MASKIDEQLIHGQSEIALRKAALLLVSVPDDEAAYLLAKLPQHQLARLTQAVSDLRSVLQVEQDVLAHELQTAATVNEESQKKDKAQRTAEVRSAGSKSQNCLLDFANANTIVSVLQHELPQTIAAALCCMEAKKSSEILSLLPTDQQIAVILRMVQMSARDSETLQFLLEDISKAIATREMSPQLRGGEAQMAQVLSYTDSATRTSILANLAAEDRALSRRLDLNIELFENRNSPARVAASCEIDECSNGSIPRAA